MKFATYFTTILLFVGCLVGPAIAGCDNSNKPCQQGNGACSKAIIEALVNGDLQAAQDALFYGKYCGRLNKCYSNEKEGFDTKGKGNLGLGKRGPPPCDDVDAACKAHDACLDRKVQQFVVEGNPQEEIPTKERCECDVKLIASQFQVLLDSDGPTGLCDADLYSGASGVSIELVGGHEAALIAGGFCCGVLERCTEDAGDATEEELLTALSFCQQAFGELCVAIAQSATP